MRIKSNASCNIGHTASGLRVLFPAQGVIELDDNKFKAHVEFIKTHVASGNLVWLKKPAESAEEKAAREAAELKAAQETVAKAAKANKA